MQKVIVISGCTGTGKLGIAKHLATLVNGELISTDSVKLYDQVRIGSNRPSKDTAHLVGVLPDVRDQFSASSYAALCLKAMSDIHGRGRVPILVGGSAFYVRASLYPHALPGPDTSPAAVQLARDQMAGLDWPQALQLLRTHDPVAADRLSPNDFYRVERALSVALDAAVPGVFSDFLTSGGGGEVTAPESSFDVRAFYIHAPDRIALYRSIDSRCERMVLAGLVKEVQGLGSPLPLALARTIGYRQTHDFLARWDAENPQSNKDLFASYLSDFQAVSRQYARRQIQWHKRSREPPYFWLPVGTTTASTSTTTATTPSSYGPPFNGFVKSDSAEHAKLVNEIVRLYNLDSDTYQTQLQLNQSDTQKLFFQPDKQRDKLLKMYTGDLSLSFDTLFQSCLEQVNYDG